MSISQGSTDIKACPDCFTGTIHTAKPTGKVETLHDVPTYISRGGAASNSTIVFLTDGFGFNLVNNKLLADQYASRTGLRVLVPNLLPGGGVPLALMALSSTVTTPVAWYDLLGHARRAWAALRMAAVLVPFGFRVRRAYPAVLDYVRAVRAALQAPGARLGLAGFCLGGHWSSRICGEPAAEEGGGGGGDGRLVDAHFTAHPSSVKEEEFAAFAGRFGVPFSLALGDKDVMMSMDQARGSEASLRQVFRDEPDKLQVTIYEGCGHGFALRSDPKQTHENEASERALDQAVAWFRRFLL